MSIDFESNILAVQITLDAHEVKVIANMYREAAESDLDAGYKNSAEAEFRKAAWFYRAVGETWYAERMDRNAERALAEE